MAVDALAAVAIALVVGVAVASSALAAGVVLLPGVVEGAAAVFGTVPGEVRTLPEELGVDVVTGAVEDNCVADCELTASVLIGVVLAAKAVAADSGVLAAEAVAADSGVADAAALGALASGDVEFRGIVVLAATVEVVVSEGPGVGVVPVVGAVTMASVAAGGVAPEVVVDGVVTGVLAEAVLAADAVVFSVLSGVAGAGVLLGGVAGAASGLISAFAVDGLVAAKSLGAGAVVEAAEAVTDSGVPSAGDAVDSIPLAGVSVEVDTITESSVVFLAASVLRDVSGAGRRSSSSFRTRTERSSKTAIT